MIFFASLKSYLFRQFLNSLEYDRITQRIVGTRSVWNTYSNYEATTQNLEVGIKYPRRRTLILAFSDSKLKWRISYFPLFAVGMT